MSLIVDASVAVEYLLRTALGERVETLLMSDALAAPELLDVEVMTVLRKEVLSGRLAPRRAAEAVDDLCDWDIERIAHRALLVEAWSLHGHVGRARCILRRRRAAARSERAGRGRGLGP